MSTTAVDLAATQGAGTTSADSGASPAGESAQDQGAILTDDAILGIGTDSSESTQAPAETVAAPTETAAQSAAPAELSIADFQPLFKDNPKVNSLWDQFDRLRTTSSRLGTTTQIAKLADSLDLIGGAEKLAELVDDAAQEEQNYASLAAGTPESRKQTLESYADWWGPDAFADVSRAGLDILKAKAPEQYGAITAQFLNDGIKNEGLYDWAARVQKARAEGKDLGELADQMVEWMYARFHGKENQASSLEAKRIESDRQKLQAERSTWEQQRNQESFERIGASIRSTTNVEITKLLDSLKINGRAVFGEKSSKAKETITQEIYARSFEKVNANPVIVARLKAMEASGGKEKDTIDLLVRGFNGVLRSVADEVVSEWTKNFVGQQKAQLDRAKTAASRPDAGSSVSRGDAAKGKITAKDISKAGGYGKLTDDQILDL